MTNKSKTKTERSGPRSIFVGLFTFLSAYTTFIFGAVILAVLLAVPWTLALKAFGLVSGLLK